MATTKSFVVIGLGQFGLAITRELVALNQQVIAIDRSVESVQKIEAEVNTAFVAECTNKQALHDVGVHRCDVAIIAFGDNIHDTILTTAILSELEVKKIVVRLDSPEYKNLLGKLGAHDFISPTLTAGRSLALRLAGSNLTDYFSVSDQFGVSKLVLPPNFKAKTLMELDWRNKYDINIILMQKRGTKKDKFGDPLLPRGNEPLESGDLIFVLGTNENLLAFSDMLQK
jgi:trk system potassium uptake protein TrkA